MIWKTSILLCLTVSVLCYKRPLVSEKNVKLILPGQHDDLSIEHEKPEARETYAHAYPSYEFSYKVDDPQTHDKKAQHEVSHGGKVTGNYWLMQRNGEKRYIKYQADDKSGFTATVKYSSPHSEVYYNNMKGSKDGNNADVKRRYDEQGGVQDGGQESGRRDESGREGKTNKHDSRNDGGRDDQRDITKWSQHDSRLSSNKGQYRGHSIKQYDGDIRRDIEIDGRGGSRAQSGDKDAKRDSNRGEGQDGGVKGDTRQNGERDEKERDDGDDDKVWWYEGHDLGGKKYHSRAQADGKDAKRDRNRSMTYASIQFSGQDSGSGKNVRPDSERYGKMKSKGRDDGEDDSHENVWWQMSGKGWGRDEGPYGDFYGGRGYENGQDGGLNSDRGGSNWREMGEKSLWGQLEDRQDRRGQLSSFTPIPYKKRY